MKYGWTIMKRLTVDVDVIKTAIPHKMYPGPRRSEARIGPVVVTAVGDGVP